MENLGELELKIKHVSSPEDFREIKQKINSLFKKIKELPQAEKGEIGQKLNELKKLLSEALEKNKKSLSTAKKPDLGWLDVTRPVKKKKVGGLHPLSQVIREITSIFRNLGFEIIFGPETETEWNNFDALNIPEGHPSRDNLATFWIKQKNLSQNKLLLRSHTSPTQIRFMKNHQPPFRIISPGKVYRFEAIDASHNIEFWQVEGLFVDKEIGLNHLKDIVETFLKEFFKRKDLMIRWLPSYYPFVEPGLDVVISFDGKKWLEIAGSGLVHPQVFKNSGYNAGQWQAKPCQWQGFAFGMGIDRLTMLKYKIPDIRLLHSADLRFLEQF